jgi:hypothetical protein
MDRVPGDSFDLSNGRLIHSLDTEGGDFIERGERVLELMVRRPGVRTERLPASPTVVWTTLPPRCLVEAMAADASGSGFSRPRVLSV